MVENQFQGWADLAPYTPIGTLTFVGTESHAPEISFAQLCQEKDEIS